MNTQLPVLLPTYYLLTLLPDVPHRTYHFTWTQNTIKYFQLRLKDKNLPTVLGSQHERSQDNSPGCPFALMALGLPHCSYHSDIPMFGLRDWIHIRGLFESHTSTKIPINPYLNDYPYDNHVCLGD
jgi:hypothetical protein